MNPGTQRQELLERLAASVARVERPHPVRVAIDGPDAAGKTTLADELAPLVEGRGRPVIRVSVDCFHRPREARYRRGELSPEGMYFDTFDYDAVRNVLLEPLGPTGDGRYCPAVFDLKSDEPIRLEWRQAAPEAVVLCDGVFLHRPELAGLWDLTIFLETDLDVSVGRAIERDSAWLPSREAARERYRLRYTPAQRFYFREVDPAARADIVIENTDPSAPVLVSGEI